MLPFNPSVELAKFGAELRRHREEAGLTLAALAERSGLSVGYISLIERGERDPSISTVTALAKALGISPGEFLKPMPKMGPIATHFAEVFDLAPPDAQEAIIMIIRAAVRIHSSKP
jgi:transcriptional regulator with XRE-family HTH domain